MSTRPKILVLELGRLGLRRHKPQNKKLAAPSVPKALPIMLLCMLWVLKFLGFRVTTLSRAMAAPYGRFVCLTIDGIDRGLPRLIRTLQRLSLPITLFVPTYRVGRPGALTWADLQRLHTKSHWEIGSMGHNPVDLSARAYVEQRRLIVRAKSLMTDRLGKVPTSFSYPYGAYDATTLSCLRDEGITAAVTLRRGLNIGATDQLQLQRLSISPRRISDLWEVLRIAASAHSQSPTATAPVIRPGEGPSKVRSGAHS